MLSNYRSQSSRRYQHEFLPRPCGRGEQTARCRRTNAGNYLALVLSGKLKTLKDTEFPEHPFVTGIFSAGTVVGEDGFLNDLPRSSTVRVLQTCELLVLTRGEFEQLEQSHPEVANLIFKWLLNLLSNRLHNAHGRLAVIF